jgi:hypothetical protein
MVPITVPMPLTKKRSKTVRQTYQCNNNNNNGGNRIYHQSLRSTEPTAVNQHKLHLHPRTHTHPPTHLPTHPPTHPHTPAHTHPHEPVRSVSFTTACVYSSFCTSAKRSEGAPPPSSSSLLSVSSLVRPDSTARASARTRSCFVCVCVCVCWGEGVVGEGGCVFDGRWERGDVCVWGGGKCVCRCRCRRRRMF